LEIGLFQLENLLLTRTGFCFLDLRGEGESTPAAVASMLSSAHRLLPADTTAYLQDHVQSKEHPIVLICADGRASQTMAQSLEASGYKQVYVVNRGVSGLLEDL